MPLFGLHFLRLPFFGEVVDSERKPSIFSIYPSFAFVGERDDADASYLAGIPDVDSAIELGAGAAKATRTSAPMRGHFAAAKVEPTR